VESGSSNQSQVKFQAIEKGISSESNQQEKNKNGLWKVSIK
jgi:hypothetical protein